MYAFQSKVAGEVLAHAWEHRDPHQVHSLRTTLIETAGVRALKCHV